MRTVTGLQLKNLLQTYVKLDEVLCIHGMPGVGKSAIVEDVCQKNNWQCQTLLLSIRDTVDLHGLPKEGENGRMEWMLPSEIPLFDDELEDTLVIFLDEITTSSREVQAIAYRLLNERCVDNVPIHPNVRFVTATNLAEDRGIVNEMPSPLRNRMGHVKMEPDAESWVAWASSAGVHPAVVSFIDQNPQCLHKMTEDDIDNFAFPTPRTWEKVSWYLNSVGYSEEEENIVIDSFIGPTSLEFLTFKNECRTDMTAKQVLSGDVKDWEESMSRSQKFFMINSIVATLSSWSKESGKGYERERWYINSIKNINKFCTSTLQDGELAFLMATKMFDSNYANLEVDFSANENELEYFMGTEEGTSGYFFSHFTGAVKAA